MSQWGCMASTSVGRHKSLQKNESEIATKGIETPLHWTLAKSHKSSPSNPLSILFANFRIFFLSDPWIRKNISQGNLESKHQFHCPFHFLRFPKIGVSPNSWMLYNRKSHLNRWFGGAPILGNLHILWHIYPPEDLSATAATRAPFEITRKSRVVSQIQGKYLHDVGSEMLSYW